MKSEDIRSSDSSAKSADKKVVHNSEESSPSDDIPAEFGGRKDGLDPTRYGDWEKNGRCIDF